MAGNEIALKAKEILKANKNSLAKLKPDSLRVVLEPLRERIEQVLPKHITAERILQMSTELLTHNPKIAECTPSSIAGAIVQASILGFEPVSAKGHCYFVPYWNRKIQQNELQLQIGYRGWILLFYRNPLVASVEARVVRKGDEFAYEYGTASYIQHKPMADVDAPITHAYAIVKLTNGGTMFEVLTRARIEMLRLRNPTQKDSASGAWDTDYDMMAQAKVIKRLSRFIPADDRFAQARSTDDAVITLETLRDGGEGVAADALDWEAWHDDSTESTGTTEAKVVE